MTVEKNSYFCRPMGGLAQLARALAWHARGHRFDSDILHKTKLQPPIILVIAVFFIYGFVRLLQLNFYK